MTDDFEAMNLAQAVIDFECDIAEAEADGDQEAAAFARDCLATAVQRLNALST